MFLFKNNESNFSFRVLKQICIECRTKLAFVLTIM